eukprot:4413293-Prymnesium_polylepis.1
MLPSKGVHSTHYPPFGKIMLWGGVCGEAVGLEGVSGRIVGGLGSGEDARGTDGRTDGRLSPGLTIRQHLTAA